jgi:ATP-binding cassette subfamily F protein uup
MSASNFLTLFLFPPEQQYTYLSKLSGGEKKRLQLLTVLFRNPNFLILDEPTNDLDLPTLSVLENFLSEFQGCLLIVSHDRYFMDRLIDHMFVFEGDGVITDFPGNYTDYRISEKTKDKNKDEPKTAEVTTAPTILATPVAPEKKKRSFKEQREFEQIESTLAKLEDVKIALTHKMATPNISYDELMQAGKRMEDITSEIEQKEIRWLELSEKE